MKGRKVSPSHYINQDLETIWLNLGPVTPFGVWRRISRVTHRWRKPDSNHRSPVGETDVGYPARPLRDAGCSSMQEGTADREIALLTGGNRMSRVLRPI